MPTFQSSCAVRHPAGPIPVARRQVVNITTVVSCLLLGGLAWSLRADFVQPQPNSILVRGGFVRADQLVADMSYAEMLQSPEIIRRRVASDSGNPYRWAELGEYMQNNERFVEAQVALDRAAALGPEIPSILMREANFYLLRDKPEKMAALGKRILALTSDFDQILFINYAAAGLSTRQVMQLGVPENARAARSWLVALLPRARPEELMDAWEWLRVRDLADQTTAEQLVSTLWDRHLYQLAAETWTGWLGSARGDYLKPNLLANRRFTSEPAAVPLDWKVGNTDKFVIHNGLSLFFSGNEAGGFVAAAQLVPVRPGRYRFTAELTATDITTDEGPYFRFYDAEKIDRFNMLTPGILGSSPRHAIHYEFVVPAGTRVLGVQLERKASLRFDNKIKGQLLIHEVLLLPDGR